MTKDEIRNQVKAQRRQLTAEQIVQAGGRITDRLLSLDCCRQARTVMVYLSAFKEPATDEMIKRLNSAGKRLAAPISHTDTFTITPAYLGSPDSLTAGAYGIQEPSECLEAAVSDIDIALIPGIVFDKTGARIGFGKGYYDRFLAGFKGLKIGICYDFQVFDRIPSSFHDVKMDLIITEKRIYNDF